MPDHKPEALSVSPVGHVKSSKEWLWFAISSVVIAVGGAFFIVELVHKITVASAIGLLATLLSLCANLLSAYWSVAAKRRIYRRVEDFNLSLSRIEAIEGEAETGQIAIFEDFRTRELRKHDAFESLESDTETTPSLDLLLEDSPSLLDSPGLNDSFRERAVNDSIGKLKELLDERAARDDSAMQASLEFAKTITRGQPANTCEYRVWFGTDRRLNVDGDFSQGFKEEFSDELRCGSCVVYVPQSHVFASLGSNPIARIFKKISGKPSDAPLKLLAIEAGTPESFVNDLRASLRALPENERDLVLFVHGYNVDFESAAIRSAQIGRDLELPGPMLFYSWPSKANLPGYWADEATIDRTLPKFVRFLELLIAIPELSAVNVIAHSMGNRLFQRAMQLFSFRQQATDKRFGHVILAAPDIDRETFRQAAQDYARLKASAQRRTAVYFNKNDVAVSMSRWIHQEARAGTQGGAFANTDSILWIDSLFRLDWLGHGYFASAAPVLKDMKELLVENKAPAQRQPPLTPVPSDIPQYWELRA